MGTTNIFDNKIINEISSKEDQISILFEKLINRREYGRMKGEGMKDWKAEKK